MEAKFQKNTGPQRVSRSADERRKRPRPRRKPARPPLPALLGDSHNPGAQGAPFPKVATWRIPQWSGGPTGRRGAERGSPRAGLGAFGERGQEGPEQSSRDPTIHAQQLCKCFPRREQAGFSVPLPRPRCPDGCPWPPLAAGSGTPEAWLLHRPPRACPPRRGETPSSTPTPARAAARSLLTAGTPEGVVTVERRPRQRPSACVGGEPGAGGARRGRVPLSRLLSTNLAAFQSFCRPKAPTKPYTRRGEGNRGPRHVHAPHLQFGALRGLPPPPLVSSGARVLPTAVHCHARGESPTFTNLGRGRRGLLQSFGETAAPRSDTRHAPSPPGAGSQLTYVSAGRGPDSGLAAGLGAVAAGAASGRRHPSSGRPGGPRGAPRRERSSSRRVHRARASRPARPSRCLRPPTRVRAGAALRRSSPGLVPASPRQSAPWGPPRRGRAPLLRQAREPPGARRAGEWHPGPRRSPRARRPCRSRLPPARSPLPPPRAGRCRPRRTAGSPAPFPEAPPTCHSPARPRPHLRGRPPARPRLPCSALSLTGRRTFHLGLSLLFPFIPSFLMGPRWLAPLWAAWRCGCCKT